MVDGTGAPARTADVAIDGDRIVEVGRVAERGDHEIDADGALVAPGWVDVHTHYDGQAIWDAEMAPSAHHGVTTAVMGNCGVGFAPVRPGSEDFLIEVMEGGGGHPRHCAARGHRLAVGDLRPVPRRARLDAAHHRPRHAGAPRRGARLRARRASPRGRPHRGRVRPHRRGRGRRRAVRCAGVLDVAHDPAPVEARLRARHVRRRRRAVGHRRRAGRRRSRPVPVRLRRPGRAPRPGGDGGTRPAAAST